QIEAGELRASDKDILWSALAAIDLNAVRAIGRREVASGRWGTRIPCRRGRAHAEGSESVVNDVLRQHVNDLLRIIEPQLIRVLQVLHRQADQVDKAGVAGGEVEQLATLHAAGAVEFPSADEAVEQWSGFTQQHLATPKGQLINPIDLESVSQGVGIKRVDARRAERDPLRTEGFGELIISLHLQPLR